MATPAPSFMTLAPVMEPEPLSALPDPPNTLALVPADAQRRRLDVAQCSLCAIALPLGLLVPDGGDACTDVHWYCKDAKSCTERWTNTRR